MQKQQEKQETPRHGNNITKASWVQAPKAIDPLREFPTIMKRTTAAATTTATGTPTTTEQKQ